MTNRITRMVVVLDVPLLLRGAETPVPPGRYEVTTEEEPLGDLMEPGYRRIAATLYVPPPPGRIGIGQVIDIETPEFEALLAHRVAAAA
ncbi:hypothetical protein BH10PSE7_BH10PSE7_38130 [soil metagenome]